MEYRRQDTIYILNIMFTLSNYMNGYTAYNNKICYAFH